MDQGLKINANVKSNEVCLYVAYQLRKIYHSKVYGQIVFKGMIIYRVPK